MHLAGHFRGEDDVLTTGVPIDGAPDELLRTTLLVDVGGVPEGDAKFDGLSEEWLRSVLVEGPLM
jgi:hypothetical protein